MKYGMSPEELADAAAMYLREEKGIKLEGGDQIVVEFSTRHADRPMRTSGPLFKWRVKFSD